MKTGQTVWFKYDTAPSHLTAHTKWVRTVTNDADGQEETHRPGDLGDLQGFEPNNCRK